MSDKPTKQKIVAEPENCIIIDQPMVRNFSTGGGHGPEDTLVEGDEKFVTRKWQGYPPQNLNLIGKPHTAMPEVGIPRLTGKAEYTTRILLPNTLQVKMLTSPHPRSRVKTLDVSKAEKTPGVAYILTAQNAPKTHRGSGRGRPCGGSGGVRTPSVCIEPGTGHGAECTGPEYERQRKCGQHGKAMGRCGQSLCAGRRH